MVSTRRELLEAGAASLAGFGLIRQSAPAPHGSTGTRLEADRPAAVGISAERLDRVAQCLEAETAQGHVTSASICVARQGRIVLHRGFGRLNEQPNAPRTGPDTVYILASISKPIAVTGLMVLVERGEVVLSDRVQRYLPDFEGQHKEKARVWHLLSHSQGCRINSRRTRSFAGLMLL